MDIIILFDNSSPSLIMTYDDFSAQANNLRGQLLSTRKKGLESDKYEDNLRFVLEDFYDLVGNPVIKKLNEMNVPKQCRIWWCPTSVFLLTSTSRDRTNPITLDSTMFFWVYTFPHISHPSPHSLNPESQARRRLASLRYFLSLSQMKNAADIEREKPYKPSIPR